MPTLSETQEQIRSLGHISKQEGLYMLNMQQLGLGNIAPIATIPPISASTAYIPICNLPAGKDSIAGHREIMGHTTYNTFQ